MIKKPSQLSKFLTEDLKKIKKNIKFKQQLDYLERKILKDTMKSLDNFCSMKLNKPAFWDKKIGLISILLYPISLIYLGIIYLKRLLKKKFLKFQLFV